MSSHARCQGRPVRPLSRSHTTRSRTRSIPAQQAASRPGSPRRDRRPGRRASRGPAGDTRLASRTRSHLRPGRPNRGRTPPRRHRTQRLRRQRPRRTRRRCVRNARRNARPLRGRSQSRITRAAGHGPSRRRDVRQDCAPAGRHDHRQVPGPLNYGLDEGVQDPPDRQPGETQRGPRIPLTRPCPAPPCTRRLSGGMRCAHPGHPRRGAVARRALCPQLSSRRPGRVPVNASLLDGHGDSDLSAGSCSRAVRRARPGSVRSR